MKDFVLRIVPTDPYWQPTDDEADRASRLVASLALAEGDGGWCEIKWDDQVDVADCGTDLERVSCPYCRADIGVSWWERTWENRHPLADLSLVVPCCDTATTFDALVYDRPLAYARFQLAIGNPSRLLDTGADRFDEAATDAIAQALGHPIRQVSAHY